MFASLWQQLKQSPLRKAVSWKVRRYRDYLLRGQPVPPVTHYGDKFIYSGQAASDLVYETLNSGKPVFIGKYGNSELGAIRLFVRQKHKSRVRYTKRHIWRMEISSGFINPTPENLTRYCSEAIRITRDTDIMGVWFIQNERQMCVDYLPAMSRLVFLFSLSPLFLMRSERPWSRYLEGKRVLVVHPFADSIRAQYQKRHLLFANPRVLPEFDLTVIKAYQSMMGNNPDGFHNWFDALDSMKEQIAGTNFDVALIAAGAYGFFLGHYCKQLGRQALHLGGDLQLLFGIKGVRWEETGDARLLYNEHWVRPMEHETPPGHKQIERGCYW